MIQEELILKAHVAPDKMVWQSDGICAPVNTGRKVSDFVAGLHGPRHLRVLGTHENAELITLLYQRYCHPGGTGRLEVASPLLCETASERLVPRIVLLRMRQCQLSPSLGGWHQFTELDYPSYAIAARCDKDHRCGEHIRRLMQTHPAWHDLTFISGVSIDGAATVIALILDPRWFVDTNNPYRVARIQSFLGLTPAVQRKVSLGQLETVRAVRCRAVLGCWKGMEPSPADIERPGNFLWRRWRHAGGGVKGDLRASQAFIVYLVRNWQAQLVSKSVQRVEMFIPEQLLRGAEVAAYKHHAAQRPQLI